MDTPSTTTALHDLAREYGIEESYVDIEGRRWHANPDALLAILIALGVPVRSIDDAPAALAARRRTLWQRPLSAVCVAWGGHGSIGVRLPASVTGSYHLTLTGERGEVIEAHGTLSQDADAIATHAQLDGTTYVARQLPLPQLPLGYYTVALQAGTGTDSVTAEAHVLSAPERAFRPSSTRRHWGVFTPLYALHAQDNRGAGNLGDLRALMRHVEAKGGSAVGTLPLLAAYLDEPFDESPYSPASRLAWNELYLDIEALPEYANTPAAWTSLHRAEVHATVAELAAAPLVDYRRQFAVQRGAVETLASACWDAGGARKNALLEFGRQRPEIDLYARFRAVVDRQRQTWPNWPESLRGGVIADSEFAPEDYRYHLYAQWGMHQQLAALSDDAPDDALGLYLDLPVGVGGASFDTWLHPEAFVRGLSTGAPPDLLFAGGQNWAFPPMHPERIREDGYRYLIAVLRNHLRYAGVLRIDHVMGLHRLYVIPDGCTAKEGIYIKYRSEELYALLLIESHRSGTLLAGEDLGTVPDVVRETMSRTGVHGLHVVQYEAGPGPADALPAVPADSVAAMNTHDMPPFSAYWNAHDVDDRAALGWLDEHAVTGEKAHRARVRANLRKQLRRHGPLSPGADDRDVLRATVRHLGRSDATLALVSLEDLWGEIKPQNVPGTWRECPNWRRRAALSLEALQADPRVQQIFDDLDHARTGHGRTEIGAVVPSVTRLTDDDIYLLGEGTHERLYDKLGAHPMVVDGVAGVVFAIWAPSATYVSVISDFNDWDSGRHPLSARAGSGVWEGFVPGVQTEALYKFHIGGAEGWSQDKSDPMGIAMEGAPRTASVVADLSYEWNDATWMAQRAGRQGHDAPISIYEVHLGSWMRVPEEDNRFLSYREVAPKLAAHVRALGFTHVELLPVMEHPFYGSWGYQVTGYFAATARYGSPTDLMALVDHLHGEGIGVIMDWVPSHFPDDAHGLALMDGTHVYEHADPRQGFHPDWNSAIFNYGRHEVQAFLVSSALYWLDLFHIDGLRVDGVASMLYRDYSRKEGEWIPNEYGGRENLEAIGLLRRLNEAVYRNFPDVQTYAEESTAWPMVSRPTHVGGLGFGFKWDMGWMHDMLGYLARDPIHRRFHQNELTFRMIYAWGESFVLSLSHDEVVHGKGSLLGKMPGDPWQQFANLRLLFACQWAQPGKKLLFMGGEFGQRAEWNHDRSLDWHLLHEPGHAGVMQWVGDLNRTMVAHPALHQLDHDASGFCWIDFSDATNSVVAFARRDRDGRWIVVILNFTPIARHDYRIGVPVGGRWTEVLNSDAEAYGGSGLGNGGHAHADSVALHDQPCSLSLTLPPLSALFFASTEGDS